MTLQRQPDIDMVWKIIIQIIWYPQDENPIVLVFMNIRKYFIIYFHFGIFLSFSIIALNLRCNIFYFYFYMMIVVIVNDICSTTDLYQIICYIILRQCKVELIIRGLFIKYQQWAGGRFNKKDGLTRYGDSHVKDKTS